VGLTAAGATAGAGATACAGAGTGANLVSCAIVGAFAKIKNAEAISRNIFCMFHPLIKIN